MKRILIAIFFFVVCYHMASAEIYSGSCGDNLTWSLNTIDSTLTISGSGAMLDYYVDIHPTDASAPWYEKRSYVKSLLLPSGLTYIGNTSFENCENLKSVNLPNSLQGIGEFAFAGCNMLENVLIPSNVTEIKYEAFAACNKLLSIDVDLDNQVYCSVEGILYSKDTTTLVEYPAGIEGAYAILQEVRSIGDGAFSNCSKLSDITFHSHVTTIGQYAFSRCTGLVSIDLPYDLTTIGRNAFSKCTNLTSIKIHSNVTSIEQDVFYGCTSLEHVYCYPNANNLTWERADNYSFKENKGTQCHVIASQLTAYQEKWNTGNITTDINVTFVGDLQEEATAIHETIISKQNASKIIRNGCILITNSDKTYTITGAEIK